MGLYNLYNYHSQVQDNYFNTSARFALIMLSCNSA